MDHIDQAVYDTVHNSDVAAKDIAKRLGMSHQVLLNKANPQSEFHKLTLRESLAIQLITKNHRIQQATETELRLNDDNPTPSKSVLDSILYACREHGDVVRAIQVSLEDGRFTLREREVCQQEIEDAIQALHKLRESVVSHGM